MVRGIRAGRGALVLLLVFVSIVALAPPAAAAHNPPWRWKSVDGGRVNVETGTQEEVTLYCPAGYVPVAMDWRPFGSFDLVRQAEYVDYTGNWGHVKIYNPTSLTRQLDTTLHCVHGDDVGTITTASILAGRVGTRSGGYVDCPPGTGALSAGVDWEGFNLGKRIDFSTPTEVGWYATGYNPEADTNLYIEVHCISNSYRAGAELVGNQVGGSTGQVVTSTVNCSSGKRAVIGGAFQYPVSGSVDPFSTAQGTTRISDQEQIPGFAGRFSAAASMPNNSTYLVARVLCVPVSVPALTVYTGPSGLQSTRTITYSFAASDPAGEDLRYQCALDGAYGQPCAPSTTNTINGVGDGGHTLLIEARNDSNQTDVEYLYFTVDGTAPAVAAAPPTTGAPLTDPLVVDFSEHVDGVDTSSIQVRTGASPVAGSLAVGTVDLSGRTRATFTPAKPLIPGQRYTIAISDAIHDTAGNAFVAQQLPVRTTTTVENTSVAFKVAWDPDSNAVAGDDKYVSSRTPGATVSLPFTVPEGAGQRVGVWGIRTRNGGYADVLVDGVKVLKASFYESSTARRRVFQSSVLPPGAHTITVKVLGQKPTASNGPWVNVDNLVVGTTTREQGALRQHFRRVSNTSASGGSYDVVGHGTNGDTGGPPSFVVTFRGPGVRVLGTRKPSSGAARFFVDGVLRDTVSFNAPAVTYKVNMFDMPLSDALHTLRIVPVGTPSGGASDVSVDAVIVE